MLIKTFRLTAPRARTRIEINLLCGDKQMATSTYNPNGNNTDQWERLMHAAEAALYYPSLEDNPWDDELLPSGD